MDDNPTDNLEPKRPARAAQSEEEDFARNARRGFLGGKDLVRWWRDWGRESLAAPASLADSALPNDGVRPGLLHHFSKSAMACQWDIYLNHGQYPTGPEWALAALEDLENWESQLSVFREFSELSRVNQLAAEQAVPISPRLWEILELAYGLWELTEGAFDITSASLSDCWGFLKREGRMPNDQEVAAALEPVGMDKLEWDFEQQTLRFTHPGTQLNLGGIGKGWTLDQVGQNLLEHEIQDFVFHAGQSSVLARGAELAAVAPRSTPQQIPKQGWDIGVTHPLYPDQALGTIRLIDQALGTSGSARQFIHYRGQRLSHILDPRTGRPAQGVLSATVLTPTAAQADALGTACFVLGAAGCQKLVDLLPELKILLVIPAARGIEVIQMGDWQDQWYPL